MSSDEIAAAIGLTLLPWQARILESALAQNPDGTWRHRVFRLAVPRRGRPIPQENP